MGKKTRYSFPKEKYPPSEPCCCKICRSYCIRPGWWTVEEAERALNAGYGARMMLEISRTGHLVSSHRRLKDVKGSMPCKNTRITDAIF